MIERLLPAGPFHRVRVRCSDRSDGDFHVDLPADTLTTRRQGLAPGSWTWLRQVHGARVIRVDEPGDGAGEEADASVTCSVGAVLAAQTADCVPIVLTGDAAVAVVHAGWRGVVEGVIPAAVAELRALGGGEIRALVGPHIRAENYAFGEHELDVVAAVAGEAVRSTTRDGRPALDMTAAVSAVLAGCGVDAIEVLDDDTAEPGWFSHRVRADPERQVTVAWLEPGGGADDDRP